MRYCFNCRVEIRPRKTANVYLHDAYDDNIYAFHMFPWPIICILCICVNESVWMSESQAAR